MLLYRVWYYSQFQASTVGLGMYPSWIREGYGTFICSLNEVYSGSVFRKLSPGVNTVSGPFSSSATQFL